MRILCTGGSGFIGTHLADIYIGSGVDFLNVDVRKPIEPHQAPYWEKCDILDPAALSAVLENYQPSHVIHLAANASMSGASIKDYETNTTGTLNLLEVVKKSANVSRLIISSSQHVRKPGSGPPGHEKDYLPHGLYGQSKALSEQMTMSADLNCVWTIIRPTNIWGPFHPFLPNGLWLLMKKGLYFHPKDDRVIRSYGYVKNAVWQIQQIFLSPSEKVDRKVLYIGEEPIRQRDWINQFCTELTGRKARVLPKSLIRLMALTGDILRKAGLPFPMYSERYYNLTTSNPVPTGATIRMLGEPPFSLEDGIYETADWLNKYWNQR